MAVKFAIMGFRHGHITDLIARVKERTDTALVAACEEDEAARGQMIAAGVASTVFASYERMLDAVECDVIGVGDYYAKRGAIIIEALKRGKHVISDKPICTNRRELAVIRHLAEAGQLAVGCQFDLRDDGTVRRLKRLLDEGEIGEVHAVSFGGQHPLNYGVRPGWYFEEGKQGGTINDIAIHAFDCIPWLTGRRFHVINAARNWNAAFKQVPEFRDAAQVMLTLDNGAGVLGDVSYFAPDSFGYTLPFYWRIAVWGSAGVAEMSYTGKQILLFQSGEKTPRVLDADPPTPGGYLESFLREIRRERPGGGLTTEAILRASSVSLQAQEAADHGLTNLRVSDE